MLHDEAFSLPGGLPAPGPDDQSLEGAHEVSARPRSTVKETSFRIGVAGDPRRPGWASQRCSTRKIGSFRSFDIPSDPVRAWEATSFLLITVPLLLAILSSSPELNCPVVEKSIGSEKPAWPRRPSCDQWVRVAGIGASRASLSIDSSYVPRDAALLRGRGGRAPAGRAGHQGPAAPRLEGRILQGAAIREAHAPRSWSGVGVHGVRCVVARRSVCPPEKNTIPGTAAGTWRRSTRRVAVATSATDAWTGLSFLGTTMLA